MAREAQINARRRREGKPEISLESWRLESLHRQQYRGGPYVTSSGSLRGRGHAAEHFVEAARVRRLNEAVPRIREQNREARARYEREAEKALHEAIYRALKSGMTCEQVHAILGSYGHTGNGTPSPTTALNVAAELGHRHVIAENCHTFARDLQSRVKQTGVPIGVTARGTRNGVEYVVHSNERTSKPRKDGTVLTNYVRQGVRDRVEEFRRAGWPMRVSEYRPRVPHGFRPHTEVLSMEESLYDIIAIGTGRDHCRYCIRRMDQSWHIMQASRPGAHPPRDLMRVLATQAVRSTGGSLSSPNGTARRGSSY